MSNDPSTPQQGENTTAAPELPDFEQTPWHGMIGVRTIPLAGAELLAKADPELAEMLKKVQPGILEIPDVRAVCSPLAAVERAAGGVHFDRTMPAVYFIDWFNRNKQALWGMAMHEHAMYCNLKRATERTGQSALKLVDSQGERLN
jgi:hypothetical protein